VLLTRAPTDEYMSNSISSEYKKGLNYFVIILLIYLGTVFYTLAAYYHLSLKSEWTFITALSIAIPLVFIEYLFSLNGNYYANAYLGLSPIDILIITIIFYFINLWILNYLVLKNKIHNIYSELIAFLLVIIAFFITTVIK
jgi:hypothetical protein